MLAYVLALVIGLGSIAMYMAAFFFPEVHRKEDFIWSGVGLFYALVLWVCAGRITGGVLLGQLASVALLGWFGWQTLTLRRALVPQEQQTPIPSQSEVQTKLKNLSPVGSLQGLQERVTALFRKGKSDAKTAQAQVEATATGTSIEKKIERELDKVPATAVAIDEAAPSTSTTLVVDTQPVAEATVTPIEDSTPDAVTEVIDTTATTEVPTTPVEEPAAEDATSSPELIRPNPPEPELVEAAQKSAFPDTGESTPEVAIPVEEIAPEVELAPPAEPLGPGDPEDRLAQPEAPASIEAVPLDPKNPPAQT